MIREPLRMIETNGAEGNQSGAEGLAEVLVSVPGEPADEPAGDDAQNINDDPGDAEAAERELGHEIEQEQQQEKAGHSHRAPAQPFFHGEPFHRLHGTIPAPKVDAGRRRRPATTTLES